MTPAASSGGSSSASMHPAALENTGNGSPGGRDRGGGLWFKSLTVVDLRHHAVQCEVSHAFAYRVAFVAFRADFYPAVYYYAKS